MLEQGIGINCNNYENIYNNNYNHHNFNNNYNINNSANANLNLLHDLKNIDSLLNDSKLTKKTDISNIQVKDSNKELKQIPSYTTNLDRQFIGPHAENILSLNDNNLINTCESKRIAEKENNLILNNLQSHYPEKVHLTELSNISHKNNFTPSNNKLVIREKIFIEDSKINEDHFTSNPACARDEQEDPGIIHTQENIVKVSLELEKLRNDILENHYLEKISSNNNHNIANTHNKLEGMSKPLKEKSSSNSHKKIKIINNIPTIPSSANAQTNNKIKASERESRINTQISQNNKQNHSQKDKEINSIQNNQNNIIATNNRVNSNNNLNTQNNELINNLDKSLIKNKKKSNSRIESAKAIGYNNRKKLENHSNINNNTNNSLLNESKNKSIIINNSRNNKYDADNSNSKSTEKSCAEAFAEENAKNNLFSQYAADQSKQNKESSNTDGASAGFACRDNHRAEEANTIETEKEFTIMNKEDLVNTKGSTKKNFFENNFESKQDSNENRTCLSNEQYNDINNNDNQSNLLEKKYSFAKDYSANDNILTHKLMKKIDHALLSSSEMSMAGDKLVTSQLSNRLSQRYENVNLSTYRNEKDNKTNIVSTYAVAEIAKNVLKEDFINANVLSSKRETLIKHATQENIIDIGPAAQKHVLNSASIENTKIPSNPASLRKKDSSKIGGNTDQAAEENSNENILINIYNKSFAELENDYTEYIGKVDTEQKIIFNISENLENYLNGGYPKFIEIRNRVNRQIVGFCVCNYDSNYSTGLRLVLSNYSVFEADTYFCYAEKIIHFLKNNFPLNEIYIELFYGIHNEKFYINEKFRDVFSKQLKFKWITLENTGTQRIVKYKLLNPEFNLEEIFQFKRSGNLADLTQKHLCENINSMIDIKINTMVTFQENTLNKNRDSQDDNNTNNHFLNKVASPREYSKEDTDVNIFPCIYLLSDIINKNSLSVNNENLKLFSNERTRVYFTVYILIKFLIKYLL